MEDNDEANFESMGRLRWSKRQNWSRSLQDLCCKVTVKNLPRICQSEHFENLPQNLMAQLMNSILKYKEQDGIQIEKLITRNTSKFVFQRRFLDTEQVSTQKTLIALHLLKQHSKNALRFLDIDIISELNDDSNNIAPVLFDTLKSFTRLQFLFIKLNKNEYANDILSTVGENMPDLRELKITSNYCSCGFHASLEGLTDVGLSYLCIDDGRHGKCKKLTKLSITHTKHLTSSGVLNLLENLPQLETIELCYNPEILIEAIKKFRVRHPDQTLKLTNQLTYGIKSSDLVSVLSTAPNLEVVVLSQYERIDFESLLSNESITTQFIITFDRNFIFNHLEYLMVIGPRLVELNIEKVEIEIGMIADLCPNLKHLTYSNEGLAPSRRYSHFGGSFTQLQFVNIDDNETHPIPVDAIKAMLTSKHLKHLHLCNVYNLTEDLWNEIFELAVQDTDIFSKLEVVSLSSYSNYANNTIWMLTLPTVQKLCCLAPWIMDFDLFGLIRQITNPMAFLKKLRCL